MTDNLINWDKAIPYIKCLHIVKQANISPWACFTQACHETGFFKRVIGKNNYWGIKMPARWTGENTTVMTHEFINGTNTPVMATFADWETADEAMAFYLSLLQRLYPNALKCGPCTQCYFEGLVNGPYKWATDPFYQRKLMELYEMLRKDTDIQRNFDLYV